MDVALNHDIKIEDVAHAGKHIDFANRHLHIGCIIPSATQEEVLFSIRPELFIALLATESLLPHEAVVIRGAPLFARYSGYLHSFRYAGPGIGAGSAAADPTEIVAIDAIVAHSVGQQLRASWFQRDLNKAYLGFSGFPSNEPLSSPLPADGWDPALISTGMWGCGVFMCNPTIKFCQQLMAAAVAGCRLVYSTFGKAETARSHAALFAALVAADASVGQLYRILQERDAARCDPLDAYIIRIVSGESDEGFAEYGTRRGFGWGADVRVLAP